MPRPAWAEIDLGAIAGNYRTVADMVGPSVAVCAVVKADAYGHGAAETARTALANGASRLAVAIVEEGRALREAGIEAPILVLGAVQPDEAAACVALGLDAAVFSPHTIRAFDAAARSSGSRARLHLKVDTGMTRLGCRPEEAPTLAKLIAGLPGSTLAGVFTHFASADEEDSGFTREQLGRFEAATSAIRKLGIAIPLRHAANSAAALWLPESRLDMVRIGIAGYGLRPNAARGFPVPGFRPALSIRAKIIRLEGVPAGTTVSYGRSWTAPRESRIATVQVGYADGYPRIASGRSWAGLGSARLPQVGRVCMDMCMFDATDCPEAAEGSVLCLAGGEGPSLDELAAAAGTINYEVGCHAALRLQRRYFPANIMESPHGETKGGT